ncbi:MAG: hypothetical protein ACLFS0_05480 [Bacteroidales bacterium]
MNSPAAGLYNSSIQKHDHRVLTNPISMAMVAGQFLAAIIAIFLDPDFRQGTRTTLDPDFRQSTQATLSGQLTLN